MKMYTSLAGIALLLSGAAFAQPAAGLGCTPGPHTFCVLTTADGGTGSLRQAITDSNTAGGTDTIGFAIPGTGPQTITLTSARLPFITSNVTLDGFSQPGATPNTNTPDQGPLNTQLMIAVDGGNNTDYGFYVTANVAVTLSGMAINGFYSTAIDQASSGSSLRIYGCFIGAQLDGSAFASGYGNTGVGIRIDAGQANIGGTLPAQRNLISGSRGGGIFVAQGPVAIEGNLIGTDTTGTLAIPSGIMSNWPGVLLPGNFPSLRVGCTGAGCTASGSPSRNVISGNHNVGIGIWDSSGQGTGGLEIKGNYIGTDWTGTKPLPNGHLADSNAGCPTYCAGIQLQGSTSVAAPASIIGGFNPGEANLIAFNNGAGIISSPQYAANGAIGASFDSQGNAIHGNADVDIDIGAFGHTPNDPGDGDTGANNVQNYPLIQSASVSGTPGNLTLNVTYLVDSATNNSSYPLRIDFYVDVDEGSGEFLVSDSYATADARMPRSVSLPLPPSVQMLVGFVAAATDANGYTSEFSPSHVFDRIFSDRFEGH